jgi:succinyl-diaminopimelate desuccinylase
MTSSDRDAALDLTTDVVALTRAVVDIPSESGEEARLADAVEAALGSLPHLTVDRIGHSVVARTDLGHPERVVIAGHLDTVPAAGNLPARLDGGDLLHGLGACDMKGGVAVALRLAATVPAPTRDITYVFYECEEVEGDRNGLGTIAAVRPDLLKADLAILMEPSDAGVEAGCQGVLMADITVRGERAHTARAWRGVNAAHRAGAVLQRLAEYTPERVVIDGLEYREGLNAVAVRSGVAGNVVPDTCVITVNSRFAPSRSAEEAEACVRDLFPEYEVEVTEAVPGALPGLAQEAVASLVGVLGAEPRPKLGWTDVARFAALGVPALNYGPGDPVLAHTAGEYVPVAQLRECEERLRSWLLTP